MSLQIEAVEFNNGKVNLEVDDGICKLSAVGFTDDQEQLALAVVMQMVKNIKSIKKVEVANNEPSDADLNDVLNNIRRQPTFQLDKTGYSIDIIRNHNDYSKGSLNTFLIDVAANSVDKLANDQFNKLVSKLKSKYDMDDLYLLNNYCQNGKRIYVFAIYQNASELLSLAGECDLSQRKINSIKWNDVFDGGSYITFRMDNDDECASSWSASLAAVTIDNAFDKENVLFIHPIIPIVVVKL